MAVVQIQKVACNFCGKTEDEVAVLITGQSQRDAICNECVEVCVDEIAKHAKDKGLEPK